MGELNFPFSQTAPTDLLDVVNDPPPTRGYCLPGCILPCWKKGKSATKRPKATRANSKQPGCNSCRVSKHRACQGPQSVNTRCRCCCKTLRSASFRWLSLWPDWGCKQHTQNLCKLSNQHCWLLALVVLQPLQPAASAPASSSEHQLKLAARGPWLCWHGQAGQQPKVSLLLPTRLF